MQDLKLGVDMGLLLPESVESIFGRLSFQVVDLTLTRNSDSQAFDHFHRSPS